MMRSTHLFPGLAASVLLLLSACAPATPATTMPDAPATAAPTVAAPAATAAPEAEADAMTDKPAELAGGDGAQTTAGAATMATETAATADAAATPPATVERPAWQMISLTDARTGAAFTLADFAGQTVFVEPFATWCGNCRQQLTNVQAARAALGDDVVIVALSVEPNIGNDALASYADSAGFDMVFAAMPQEMLQALAAQYGQTIANPPATPHFIIRPDGSSTDLVTGIETPAAIVGQIEAARGG
ncbi:MAG: TlpA family protein disulfide reductase [Caldilineaceae bacterium]|nr:TlpA family protein disulfide reductase [Caldilineaceae bacterium]